MKFFPKIPFFRCRSRQECKFQNYIKHNIYYHAYMTLLIITIFYLLHEEFQIKDL